MLVSQAKVIVFDLNGVVLRFSFWQALQIAWHSQQKLLLLKAACHPFLIKDVLKLLYHGGVVEQAVLAVGKNYPSLAPLVPLALKLANAQVPIAATVNLIQELHLAGYQLFIFSNLGPQSGQILQKKYPQLFSLFTGALLADPNDNYLRKPHLHAFHKFLNKFALNPAEIIFIDDRRANILAAQQLGMQTVLFKNAKQCRLALEL